MGDYIVYTKVVQPLLGNDLVVTYIFYVKNTGGSELLKDIKKNIDNVFGSNTEYRVEHISELRTHI